MMRPIHPAVVSILFLLPLAGFIDPEATTPDSASDYQVTVHADGSSSLISPLLMGFNTVYPHEKDRVWKEGDGKIPQFLKKIDTRILRYPGGTVTTFYHWENLTGQGWKDTRDPEFDQAKNQPASEMMDLDEYLTMTQKLGIEPLIGVNLGSGMRFKKTAEGIQEALRLMKYCLDKNIHVKYYYLDNEPYMHDANYTFTAEEYADQVNRYADAMRKVDPAIMIIVNTHPGKDDYTRTLIRDAGKNIDLVDVHYYWGWGRATFDLWKSQPQMMQAGRGNMTQRRKNLKAMCDSLGYPDIDLISLEWNIGPLKNGVQPNPKAAEAALMVSEQFADFINSGMPMACFWPVSWPASVDWTKRALLDSQRDYEPNKVYYMFDLYKPVMGQQRLKSSVSAERLISLAVKSTDGKTMWIYLINKSEKKDMSSVQVALNGFKASSAEAISFDISDRDEDAPLEIKKINVSQGAGGLSLDMPQFSFVRITLKK